MRTLAFCRFLALAAGASLAAAGAPAQGFSLRPYWSRESGNVALRQAALDAATDQLALVVASHPDDRHVMPAAYLRFARGWRVAVLLMTRGEGGQNSMGPEIGDELGWRRTLEAEACAAMVDAEMWYLNRQDAGYCRTAEEALELWGREETVRRLARLVREIRPDVVLTTHGPDEEHGHDLALLAVLPEALERAADPSFEPAGRPLRVAKAFRAPAGAEEDAVVDLLPMEDRDRARGATYNALAYAALKRHQTQEPIRPKEELFDEVVPLYPLRPADRSERSGWTLVEGLPSLFDLVEDTPEMRELKRDLDELVDKIGVEGFLEKEAVRLYTRLLRVAVASGSQAEVRLQRRLEALQRVILHASGFTVTADVPPDAVAVTGRPFPLRIRVQNPGRPIFRDVRLTGLGGGQLDLVGGSSELLGRPPHGRAFTVAARYLAPPEASDRRTWLERLFGGDTFAPPVRLECRIAVADPASGEIRFGLGFPVVVPVDLRPAVELQVIPRALLLRPGKGEETLAVTVTRHTAEPIRERLEVLGPPGFVVEGSPVPVRMQENKYQSYRFRLRGPEGLRPGVYNLHVVLGSHRAVIPVHKVDVLMPQTLSIGLVRGVDDTAEVVLRAFVGERLQLLDQEDLALRSLDELDTVVIDIRALRERPGSDTWRAARAAFPRLLEYVRGGGRLVVFYHKDTEFNPESAGFVGAPYPLRIGRTRVTREDAPVEIVRAGHRLLNFPNPIHPDDWDGWVQERGLYFPEHYAPEYEEILAMGDPGHERSRGALLYARHGRGDYVYCALALYRQLDSLHPGACRILANLVSREDGR